MMTVERDFAILGAGVTGLAAATVLGRRSTVLEKEDRPGGLVRSERYGAYWFDRVLHVLYFPDAGTGERVRELLGEELGPMPPEAWVETRAGTARFPLQLHLGAIEPETRVKCLTTLAQVSFGESAPVKNFEEWLTQSFGSGLCELFLFPYNRKMWQRPLSSLAVSGDFNWTIQRPPFEEVLRGAFDRSRRSPGYNADGWYPIPADRDGHRGMERLSIALSRRVADLRLGHRVETVDLESRTVTARCPDGSLLTLRYRKGCLATIPLPYLVEITAGLPASLADQKDTLRWNRVCMAMFSMRGPRPAGTGHWRYYADESLAFTRLIFMQAFDPQMAPADGWGLMAEVPQPAEDRLEPEDEFLERLRSDVERCGVLPPGTEFADSHRVVVDPAYVRFTPESAVFVDELRSFFAARDVTVLGRYGRWEYSSMGQNMRDGFAWADERV